MQIESTAASMPSERVDESLDLDVPAFQASILFSFITTRLRAWLLPAGASRLVSVPIRSRHKAASHFQASLEEAAVRRPGRQAGISNYDGFERRRCGTRNMRPA